jgi:hypothetical protein
VLDIIGGVRMDNRFERMLAALLLTIATALVLPVGAQATPVLQGAVSRQVHGTAGTFDLPLGNSASDIKDVRLMTISPGTVTGHASAGGAFPADVDFINKQAGDFLDVVTAGGRMLK